MKNKGSFNKLGMMYGGPIAAFIIGLILGIVIVLLLKYFLNFDLCGMIGTKVAVTPPPVPPA